MLEINVKEARSKLSHLLDMVERGEEVIITRRGKKSARLISPTPREHLPDLKKFRKTIRLKGKLLSETVVSSRDEERY